MENKYQRLSEIRNKIEEHNFTFIYNFLLQEWLSIDKRSYILALKKLWMVTNDSYCKYVFFIKKYLIKKKWWKLER